MEKDSKENYFQWNLNPRSLFLISKILSTVSLERNNKASDLRKEAQELLMDLYWQTHDVE